MQFRLATINDLPIIQKLYVDTIMNVCTQYTEEERSVWASGINNKKRWTDMLETQYVLLAYMDNSLAGFATLKNHNCIDFFYVNKDFQRQGVAQQLLDKIESEAKSKQATFITSDISMNAKPFFEKNGYVVLKEQHNQRKDVVLINYNMEKAL